MTPEARASLERALELVILEQRRSASRYPLDVRAAETLRRHLHGGGDVLLVPATGTAAGANATTSRLGMSAPTTLAEAVRMAAGGSGRVSLRTVQRWAARGELEGVVEQHGTRWLVTDPERFRRRLIERKTA